MSYDVCLRNDRSLIGHILQLCRILLLSWRTPLNLSFDHCIITWAKDQGPGAWTCPALFASISWFSCQEDLSFGSTSTYNHLSYSLSKCIHDEVQSVMFQLIFVHLQLVVDFMRTWSTSRKNMYSANVYWLLGCKCATQREAIRPEILLPDISQNRGKLVLSFAQPMIKICLNVVLTVNLVVQFQSGTTQDPAKEA